MKTLIFAALFFLMNSYSFAYDPSLFINVKKVTSLLKRAEPIGISSNGSKCQAEIRRIEDGYYTLLLTYEGDKTIFIGLDLEVYGKTPVSKWTKRSFELHELGADGSQDLVMKEQFSSKKLMIKAHDELKGEFNGERRDVLCYLPIIQSK
jgi:hypothetical protein